MSGDAFTRQKFEWIKQVALDGSLPPSALRIAVVLAEYLNRSSGDAWPSIPRVAAELEIVENCVRKSIKEMYGGRRRIKGPIAAAYVPQGKRARGAA